VIGEQIKEVIALLNEAVALLERGRGRIARATVEIRIEFDRIMHKIDEIRLSDPN
jgi:hypothetical protein